MSDVECSGQLNDSWQPDAAKIALLQARNAELERQLQQCQLQLQQLEAIQPTFAQQILESTSAILYVYDLVEQRNVYVNHQIAEVLGYSPAEIQAMGDQLFINLVHPDDLPRVLEKVRQCFSGKDDDIFEVEYRMRYVSGEWRWLQSRDKIFKRAADGTPQQMIGTAVDISDRKTAEIALRQYEQLVSANPERMSLVDRNYIYRLISESYLPWSGKQRDEIVGHSVSELHGEAVFQSIIKPYLDRCFAGEKVHYEAWFTDANHEPHFLGVSYAPYQEPDGSISGAIVICHDLTDLKRAEVALAESDTFLRSIYNNTQVSLFIVDVLPDGEFRYGGFNPAHEQFTGISTEALYGKTPEEIFPPDFAAAVRQHYQDCVDAGSSITYDEQLVFNQQDTWWITTLTPVRDNQGQIYRIVGSSLNVTDRVERERERERERQKSQLLSEITIKIRQSLNLDEILQTTVNEVQQLLQVDRVLIYRLFPPDWFGVITTEAVSSPNYSILHQQIVDSCFAANCVERYRQGRISYTHDILEANLQDCHKALLQQFSVRANLVVPLLQDHTLWGLLIAHQCHTPRHWRQDDIYLLQQLANQVSLALDQSQLVESLRQWVAQEQGLNRVIQAVRSSLDLDTVFTLAIAEMAELLQVDRVMIAQYLPERAGWLHIAQHRCNPQMPDCLGIEIPDAENPFAAQLKQLEVVRVNDTSTITDAVNQELAQIAPGAWLLVPIVVNQKVWGSLTLSSQQHQFRWTDGQVELAQAVADQVAIAIQQTTLLQQVQQLNQDLELRVEQRTSQLHLALSAAKMGTWEWDIVTDAVRWSPEIYEFLKYQTNCKGHVLDEAGNLLSPMPTNDLFFARVHPDDRELVYRAELVALQNQQLCEIEFRIVLPDGTLRWFYDRATCILDEHGNPTKLFGVCMDINDRKQIELERQRAEVQLRASLREKEVLLKEIHHRVKNNLQIISSLLNLQADTLPDPHLLDLFRESQRRIKVMAMIHEQLYRSNDLAQIDFAQYVQSLIADLFQSYIPIGLPIRLTHHVDSIELGLDVVIPCGLIINELVSNAIKHAFPDDRAGEVQILFTFNEITNQFLLRICDNGVGLPSDIDIRNTKSLGLQIVCELVGQLEGTLEVIQQAGTMFHITFPRHRMPE